MSTAADPGVLAKVPLQNRELATATFLAVSASLPAEYVDVLPNLLAEVPNPDQALNLLERLIASQGAEFSQVLRRNPSVLHYTVALLGHSFWLGETLLRSPDLFSTIAREKYLDRVQSREDYEESFARYRSRSLESDISLLLARFKKREYIRILLRDALGIATLAEVTSEISALSDVLIEQAAQAALVIMRARHAAPQRTGNDGRLEEVPFAVLSLGKLGGNEVNYSSDVDLLYLYGDGEEVESARISNREYFIRFSHVVSEILGRATADGAAFRIDLRLRPQGGQGEPAVSLSYGLEYYREKAHDWELQALIKVRHSAGDRGLARTFIRGVQPYVYRREINFSAIKTALQSRERIDAKRRHRQVKGGGSDTIDVKLDHGGIRDIEFLVQCLQRVYGGEEPWLRSGGTLFSLQKLHDKRHLSGREFHDLTSAYTFFRTVEHRLQVQRGQQVHRLPAERAGLEILARSVTADEDAPVDASGFIDMVRARMRAVSAIYDRIVYNQRRVERVLTPSEPGSALANPSAVPEQAAAELKPAGQDSFPARQTWIERRRKPRLPGTLRSRRNLERFWQAVNTHGGAEPLHLSSAAVERAVQVVSVSDYALEVLSRSPELIATLGPHEGNPAAAALPPAWQTLDLPGLKLRLRREKLSLAATNILDARPVFEIAEAMTQVADESIASVIRLLQAEGIAVLALGRLGSREPDLLSDADLIFVRSPQVEAAQARKQVEEIVNALGAYTREGAMFEVDLRLRPHGREGELVCTPAEVFSYFEREAQPWEALTYTKLRLVAGDESSARPVCEGIASRIARIAARDNFVTAIREMRGKLELTHRQNPASKRRAGAFYDIDFAAAMLALRFGVPTEGSMLMRLGRLQKAGFLSPEHSSVLREAALFYRALDHAIQVVTGRIQMPNNEEMLEDIAALLARCLARPLRGNLQQEMEQHLTWVRAVFDEIVR